MEKTTTLLFVHNPKTAGTTFISIAKKNYRPEDVFTVSGLNINKSIAEFKNFDQGKRDGFRLILGHETIGLHHYLTNSTKYITYLRNPVDHFISLFYYIKRATAHGHHDIVSRMDSIHDFFDFVIEKKMDNMQSRNLADPQNTKTETMEELFLLAKQHVEELIEYVFLSEEFDYSLIFFKKKIGWKNIAAVSENVTVGRPSVEAIDSHIIERIKEINKYDIQLYNIAKERHTALLKSMQISEGDLNALQRQRKLLMMINSAKKKLKRIYHAFSRKQKIK